MSGDNNKPNLEIKLGDHVNIRLSTKDIFGLMDGDDKYKSNF